MKKIKLGDYGEFRNGVNFSKDQRGEGLGVINVKDIFRSGIYFNPDGLDKVDLSDQNNLKKYLVKDGDIFFVRSSVKREGIGKVSVSRRNYSDIVHCGFVIRYRLNTNEIDPLYLGYLLSTPLYREKLRNLSGGAAITNISQQDLKGLEAEIPEFQTQQKIASTLSAFDDLIENNTRRIEILEEMARRIYREWFVHFRYPGHREGVLVDSGTELGMIPEGWEVKKLADVADINPENISTDYKGKIEYINISGVNEGSIDETEMHDFEEAPGRAKRRVKHGDIIWSSVRPNLKAYALILNPPANQIASTGFTVIRPKKLPASFLYNFSTTEHFVQYLVNHTRGSAYPAVNVSDFKNAPILVPDEKLVEKFNQVTWANFLQNEKLSRKNKKLKATRDLLLPKLISGKIDVEEITFN